MSENTLCKLTAKQRVFVLEYLRCWNATEAAVRAGYSPKTAYSIGAENLKKPEIAAEIEREIKERAMGKDEVLIRLAEQARGDIGDFVTVERIEVKAEQGDDGEDAADGDGQPATARWIQVSHIDLEKARRLGKMHLLQSLKDGRNGLEIKMYSAQEALKLLGEHLNLFGRRDASVMGVIDYSKLSDDQLERIANGEDSVKVLMSGSTNSSPGGDRAQAAPAGRAGPAGPGVEPVSG